MITPIENNFDLEENAEVETALYGNATAEIIRTTAFSPDETGTWDFVWEWDTDGAVKGSGDILVQILVGDTKNKVARTLSSDPTQSGREAVQVHVNEDETYTLGLRYHLSVDALISAGVARFLDGGFLRSAALTAKRP